MTKTKTVLGRVFTWSPEFSEWRCSVSNGRITLREGVMSCSTVNFW